MFLSKTNILISFADEFRKIRGSMIMETVSVWLADLSAHKSIAFAFVTVTITGTVGILMAVIMELLFKLFGIQTNKADSLH